LIHAGRKLCKPDLLNIAVFFNISTPKNFQIGGIIRSVEVIDCVTQSESRWFFGPFGFVLKNPLVLPFFPCRGQLRFFDVEYPMEVAKK
jgi:hypothetical protein